MICCGEKMEELIPNTAEAAGEKHLPVVTSEEGAVHVNVGSVNHPMLAEHSIEWICLETNHGSYRRHLAPGEEPDAVFCIGDEKPIAAFAYCNLHGLWKNEI